MKTRTKCVKVLLGNNFAGSECLPRNGKLPVGKDIINRALHEKEWRTERTAIEIANELIDIWVECTVYTLDHFTVRKLILNYIQEFDKLMRHPKKGDKSFKDKAAAFNSECNTLFDIFCKDARKRRQQEEHYKLKMVDKDYAFYNDMKGERVSRCYLSSIEKLSQTDISTLKEDLFRLKLDLLQQSSLDPALCPQTLGAAAATVMMCIMMMKLILL